MSADVIQKIVFTTAATADDVAAVDVPQDGHIENIYLNTRGGGMDALNDDYNVELSFASSNTFGNNDARISILQLSEVQQFLTSGGGANGLTVWLNAIDIPVFAGERLHVHVNMGGGTTAVRGEIYLYYRTRGSAPPRRSARRR